VTLIADLLQKAGMSEQPARTRAAMFASVDSALREKGVEPADRIHVPGRIEILGKHTDYGGGRSLLAAAERGFCVASAPRKDATVRLIDIGRHDEVALTLEVSPVVTTPHWAIYPAAVVRRLVRDFGGPLNGADIAFVSDLPPSSGLSSSSALLIAAFEALRLANRLDQRGDFRRALPGVLDVAAYLGSVESGRRFRDFEGEVGVGTLGGSQDHTAILACEAGRLSRFGFAPVRSEGSVGLPSGLTFVIAVSGVAARKAAGARQDFNRAAGLSAALLEIWRRVSGGAEATLFEAVSSGADAVARLRNAIGSGSAAYPARDLEARLDQFVEETLVLVPGACDAMAAGDLSGFGALVDRSQQGAERGLKNQIEETVELARMARSLGAHAAAAFGAGFGGSVWALVSSSEEDRFRADWERAYRARFDHPSAAFFPSAPGPPLLRLPG